MATYAVKVTDMSSHLQETKQGILVSSPQIGSNCLIYLGGQKYLQIQQVRGWIGPTDSNYTILFSKDGKRFRVETFASSKDFLP